MTAEPMPIARKDVSGVCMTLAIARLACAGKAANTRPSITKTSPSAAKKSVIAAYANYFAGVACGGVAVDGLPDGLLK